MTDTQTSERYEVTELWVDSILTSSVPVDWNPGGEYQEEPGWTSHEAPDCPSCGDYGIWNADEHRWECGNGSCEDPLDEIEDETEGPMMNYHYPLADLHRVGDDPNEAATLIRDLPLCVIEWSDGSYSLALTGGGMDLSWEICEAFTRLGYLPPFRFAQDPPKLAGHSINPYLLAACKRTAEVLKSWTEQATERLDRMSEDA